MAAPLATVTITKWVSPVALLTVSSVLATVDPTEVTLGIFAFINALVASIVTWRQFRGKTEQERNAVKLESHNKLIDQLQEQSSASLPLYIQFQGEITRLNSEMMSLQRRVFEIERGNMILMGQLHKAGIEPLWFMDMQSADGTGPSSDPDVS